MRPNHERRRPEPHIVLYAIACNTGVRNETLGGSILKENVDHGLSKPSRNANLAAELLS